MYYVYMYYQIEHTLVRFNHQKEDVKLSLRSEQVLQELTEEYGITNWSVFIGFHRYVRLNLTEDRRASLKMLIFIAVKA